MLGILAQNINQCFYQSAMAARRWFAIMQVDDPPATTIALTSHPTFFDM